MASSAHAFYCFEVLAASYKQQEYPDLYSLVTLFDQWQKELKGDEIHEGAAQDAFAVERTRDLTEEQHNVTSGQQRLPSISHLRDSTSSSQSSLSTPSSVSVNSSNTQLTSTTSVNEIAPTYASRLSVTDPYPLFVTWNAFSASGHKHLRGCIGTFEPLPLEKGLESYALTSAFGDVRFDDIEANLIPKLSCSLTLLANFEECQGPLDWELDTHGIRISFIHGREKRGGTYLPDVATEQGWTKEETLENLMYKAGYKASSKLLSGASSRPWEAVRDFRVVRYTGLKASATYSEWQEWQRWAKQKQPHLWLRRRLKVHP